MKLYVASRFRAYRRVRHAIDMLTKAGYMITFDWTRTREFDGDGNLLVNDPVNQLTGKEKVDYAYADLNGVRAADGVVLLYEKGMQGAYIEVGAALADNKPVYIISEDAHGDLIPFTIFWALPNVTFFTNLNGLLQHLEMFGA